MTGKATLFEVKPLAIAELASEIRWLAELPQIPVRISSLHRTPALAAASKQRVDRLIGSMRELRYEAIGQTLSLLPGEEDWVETPRAHFFATTLFPNIDLCSLCGHNSGRWEKYVELRSRAVSIELTLAEDYFSPELMSELRLLNLLGSLSAEQRRVVQAIRSQVVEVLQDSSTKSLCSAKNPINGNRMPDVVELHPLSPRHVPLVALICHCETILAPQV